MLEELKKVKNPNQVNMFQIKPNKTYESSWFYLTFIIIIITEFIDDFLDHILGSSLLHSIIQILVFIMLFFILSKLFLGFYKKKINKLIPEELMEILRIIKEAEVKGVLINQKGIMRRLNITKPTMKKRVDALLDLQYVFFEEEGNHKYLKLTPLGDSIVM